MACVAMASTFGRCTIRVNSTTFYPGDVIRAGSGGETVVSIEPHTEGCSNHPNEIAYIRLLIHQAVSDMSVLRTRPKILDRPGVTYYDTG